MYANLNLGYLADSTRIRPPPSPFYKTPPPLPKVHDNPFNSPAPLVMPSIRNTHKRPRNTNLFPPPRGKKESQVDRSSDDTEWMNDFGDPGPMINSQPDQTMRVGIPRHPSFHDEILYNSAHPPIADTTSKRDSAIMEWRKGNRKDGFVEMQTYGGKTVMEAKKSRNPFVKGPPGAFYQGLRAVSVCHPLLYRLLSILSWVMKYEISADSLLGFRRQASQWLVTTRSCS
jgi:hypothetical protein